MKVPKAQVCLGFAAPFVIAIALSGCGGGMNSTTPTPTPTHPASRFLYVVDSIQKSVSGFTINAATGELTSTGPVTPADEAPIYAAPSPDGKFLYVANVGTNSKGVSGYRIDPVTGVLTPTAPAAFPTTGDSEPLGIVVDPASRHVYTANSRSISAFSIDPTSGVLSDVPGTPIPSQPETLLENLAITPDGHFLYATDGQGRQIWIFTIDPNGLPIPMDTPVPAGKFPEGIVVDPSGKFVYVANSSGDDISTYKITPGTGALVAAAHTTPVDVHCGPQEVAVDPASKFLFVSCAGLSKIAQFAIDPASGALTAQPFFSTGQFTQPRGIAVDASGLFLYSAWNMQNRAGTAAIASGGSLTAVSGAPETGRGPLGVVVSGVRQVQ
jgi:6-phosphogluconolactonase